VLFTFGQSRETDVNYGYARFIHELGEFNLFHVSQKYGRRLQGFAEGFVPNVNFFWKFWREVFSEAVVVCDESLGFQFFEDGFSHGGHNPAAELNCVVYFAGSCIKVESLREARLQKF